MNNQEAIEQLTETMEDVYCLSCAERLAFEMAFMALEQAPVSEDEALSRIREDENED